MRWCMEYPKFQSWAFCFRLFAIKERKQTIDVLYYNFILLLLILQFYSFLLFFYMKFNSLRE